jgi:large subunit ribosomal protein L25
MSKALQLAVQKREITGKKVSQLYRADMVVGNIFSKGKDSTNIQVGYEVMRKMYEEASFNHPIEISIDGGDKHLVLITEISTSPKTNKLQHVGFHEVRRDQKVQAEIPVELVGTSPAVLAGNIVIAIDNTILVEASPLDLPGHLEADATTLINPDDMIQAKDLKLPANVVLVDDESKVVYKVDVPRSQVETEEVSEADAVAKVLEASGVEKKVEETK